MANQKKYASITTLQTFLDNLKNLFATKTEVNAKADTSALSDYYTKTETDNMELITVDDIDTFAAQLLK